MQEYDEICLEVFLAQQEKLLGKKVFFSQEEAADFLSDCMALVCENEQEVMDCLEELGMDTCGMNKEEIFDQAEIFKLPDGRFLVVEG